MWNDLERWVTLWNDSGTLDLFEGAVNRWLLFRVVFFQLSVAQVGGILVTII